MYVPLRGKCGCKAQNTNEKKKSQILKEPELEQPSIEKEGHRRKLSEKTIHVFLQNQMNLLALSSSPRRPLSPSFVKIPVSCSHTSNLFVQRPLYLTDRYRIQLQGRQVRQVRIFQQISDHEENRSSESKKAHWLIAVEKNGNFYILAVLVFFFFLALPL